MKKIFKDFIKENWKTFIIPVVLIVVMGTALIFLTYKDARAENQRKAELKQEQQVKELEKAAEQEKEDKPYVPVKPAPIVPVASTTPSPTPQAPEKSISQQEPQQQIQNKPEEKKQEPAASTPAPTATPKSIETRKVITSLTSVDIQRLQSYPMRSTVGGQPVKIFKDFATMYQERRDDCEALMTKFSPVHYYDGAKVNWITDPHLVYYSAIGQHSVRGILELTYYKNNEFNLEPNVKYQREVEYRIGVSLGSDGKVKIALEETVWLSDFYKVVE